ncbi:hypothetical protein [Sphingomonas sp. LHG3406-1]|uniref:hypothetical protein n=1 Tax=Sphingomonas sp. LHG3406-1 TaxID=2804617 RepID=UPI00260E2DB2|nr:hypothetical protein [Sphingomonas sp. LHG3406-1]
MRTLAILTAAGALTAVAIPAAAQYYPQPQTPQPYPGQPGYGYNQQTYPQQQGGLPGIIAQLLGNRNYAANDRQLVTQCAAAAQTEVARRYPAAYGQQGYGQRPYGQAYGYNQAYPGTARVTAITNVQRRNNRNLRVTGLVDSGRYAQTPYGYNQRQAYAQGDLRFNCTVDYSGRVTNLRLSRAR